jgi:CHASE2 domain-containing sensor protein
VALNRGATRAEHADAITKIHRAGAKVIAYDVVFEKDRPGRQDDRLLRALRRAQPVVLGALVADKNAGDYSIPRLFRSAVDLNAAGVRVGLSAYPRDPDGKIRRVALAPLERDSAGHQAVPSEFDPRDMPGFPYAVALTVGGGTLKEGVAADNQDVIDFRGPPGTFKPIPFKDVLNGRAPVDVFRDRVVIVGTTRLFNPKGAGAVPTGDVMDRVEIDANAITTLLDGAPLREPRLWTRWLVLIAAAFSPLAVVAAGRWTWGNAWLVVPTMSVAIVAGAWPHFDDLIFWPWTYAAIALTVSSLGTWFVVHAAREAGPRG